MYETSVKNNDSAEIKALKRNKILFGTSKMKGKTSFHYSADMKMFLLNLQKRVAPDPGDDPPKPPTPPGPGGKVS